MGWPRFAGCILALMLLATSVVANPQLDPGNPTSFFTNVAMAMFQQMNLHDFNGNLVTVTNIPIYEGPTSYGGLNINYYTPAVHQILQLAANIFDATTNRFIDGGPTNYPTVFRPIFSSQNGIATIIGYEEVTNSSDAFLPMLNASDFVKVRQPLNSSINMYGVPWVIGARKGFPNFNEFSMANSLSVSRQLQFTNSLLGPPWQTNQVYNFAISNTFGLEAWNSYTNSYARPLQLVASNELSIIVTNESGLPLLEITNLESGTVTNFASWPGWSGGPLSNDSFQVPLFVSQIYTNAIYNMWDITYVPHPWMVLQFKLQYVLIDTGANRVVDFVNLVDDEPPIDVDRVLQGNFLLQRDQVTEYDVWETNVLNGGAPLGVLNQIDVGEGNPVGYQNWIEPNKANDENNFRVRLFNQVTNNLVDPYIAQATVWQLNSWQANDPLVHYTARDLTSTYRLSSFYNTNALQFSGAPVPSTAPLPNLGKLNVTYQPWGGYPQNPNSPFDRDYTVKDPFITMSDDWNFPAGESLTFDWLGRVHRGTPWQTIFLKPSNQLVAQWSLWNNDNIVITNGSLIYIDAAFTLPTNDWHIASLWAQWVNTNDLSALLSINNTDTNAWAARLDGFTAFTNSAPGELDPITITSNSPQAGIIAQAIQTARATTNSAGVAIFPNNLFQQVGDVLATPQLSIASPFLSTNGMNSLAAKGLTDEAIEIIPTQLLPLLRADSIGQIVPANGQLELSFSGYDGHTYAIQASSNLTDWVIISTNCPTDGIFGITNSTTSGQEFYRSVLLH